MVLFKYKYIPAQLKTYKVQFSTHIFSGPHTAGSYPGELRVGRWHELHLLSERKKESNTSYFSVAVILLRLCLPPVLSVRPHLSTCLLGMHVWGASTPEDFLERECPQMEHCSAWPPHPCLSRFCSECNCSPSTLWSIHLTWGKVPHPY